jgi:hypothetical protein
VGGNTCREGEALECDDEALGHVICNCGVASSGELWDVIIHAPGPKFNNDAAATPKTMYESMMRTTRWKKDVAVTVSPRPPELVYLKTQQIDPGHFANGAAQGQQIVDWVDTSARKNNGVSLSNLLVAFDGASVAGPSLFGETRPQLQPSALSLSDVKYGDGRAVRLPANSSMTLSAKVLRPYTIYIIARFAGTSSQRGNVLNTRAFTISGGGSQPFSCGLVANGTMAAFHDGENLNGDDTPGLQSRDYSLWSIDACSADDGKGSDYIHQLEEVAENQPINGIDPPDPPGYITLGNTSGGVVAEIAEIFLFKRKLSERLRNFMEHYLKEKYDGAGLLG